MTATKLSRRQVLGTGLAVSSTVFMPAISRAAARPVISHGLQSGDVAHDGAVIWARADRPAKMMVEVATTESFSDARTLQPMLIADGTDNMGKFVLTGMPSDQEVFYRVAMADLTDLQAVSEPLTGRFRTAPATLRDITFVWSGDTAGQGWGIDLDRGGMKTYATMLNHSPDFFIHSGDTIYADGPLTAEKEMPDGGTWKNLMTEEKAKVAETLHEFRHQWLYNMMDANIVAFNQQVPMFSQWDDHETVNNWYPNEILEDDRYQIKEVALLAARSNQAFLETNPIRQSLEEPGRIYRKIAYGPHLDVFFLDMRTYRGDNSTNDQTEQGGPATFLGRAQIDWLKRELSASTATWKIIASDMPVGLVVRDGDAHFENMANGDGPVLGREHDIAEILSGIKHLGVKNTVWLTADVHYCAAHHYSPDRAQFQDFEPFWEFVTGPIHAGSFGPNDLDNTFGPEVRFSKAPEPGQRNLPPSDGLQFFGKVDIEGATGEMTVSMIDVADTVLWSTKLTPEV